MPSYHRDPSAPTPMRFVTPDELARLRFWPIHRPIRDALLRQPHGPVVE